MRRKNCVTLVLAAITGTAHEVNNSVKRRRREGERNHYRSSASIEYIASGDHQWNKTSSYGRKHNLLSPNCA